MEKNKSVSPLQDIQNSIAQKNKHRRQLILKRILKIVSVFVLGVTLAFLAFSYDKSDYSKINSVNVVGNYFVTDEEVIDMLGFQLGTHFYSFLSSSLEDKVPQDSFVKSIEVTKHWFNQSMTIDVTEKKVIGYRVTDIYQLIAEDGSIKGLYSDQYSHLQDLPRFIGFEDDQRLQLLVDAISRTDSVLYSNISEIIRDARTYDANYLKVIMADGVQLFTSMYSLESLDANTFTHIFNRLQENQKCIVYDVFWRSTYAKPCPEVSP